MGIGDNSWLVAQIFSSVYFLFLIGLFGWFIYSINSIRKSQSNMATTLEKLLAYFQEKDADKTNK